MSQNGTIWHDLNQMGLIVQETIQEKGMDGKELRERMAESLEIIRAQGAQFAVEELRAEDVRDMAKYIARLEVVAEMAGRIPKVPSPVHPHIATPGWLELREALKEAGFGG